ncbi:MAG TPA: hypothetical protein VEO54_06295 [Thermoanaerobaculia bacterium]|nr:hypothetical protein [Thermoanaerobaculia bacterium]
MIDLLLATLVTTFPIEHLHDPRALPAAAAVREIAATGADDFVLVTGPPDEGDGRALMRLTGGRLTPLADLGRTRSANCRGSRLVAGEEGRWWYARCNDEEVEFVTSSAPSRVVTVPAGHRAAGLAPVEGDEPAVVVVAFATPAELLMRVELITPSVAQGLGDFERTGHLMYGPWTLQAHRLKDDAIALVTLEEEGSSDYRVMLRVFRNGEAIEYRLPFEPNRYVAVLSAASEHGLGVVAVEPRGGGLVAMALDPDDPLSAKPFAIKRSDAQSVAREGAAVVPLGKRFAVTWANVNDRSVRLSEFDRTMALPAARVADEADVRAHGPLLQAHQEEVSVFWPQGTATMQRVLPTEAAGYLFAVELWRRLGSGAVP